MRHLFSDDLVTICHIGRKDLPITKIHRLNYQIDNGPSLAMLYSIYIFYTMLLINDYIVS